MNIQKCIRTESLDRISQRFVVELISSQSGCFKIEQRVSGEILLWIPDKAFPVFQAVLLRDVEMVQDKLNRIMNFNKQFLLISLRTINRKTEKIVKV